MYIYILLEDVTIFLQEEINEDDMANVADELLTIINPKTLQELVWDEDESKHLWKNLPKENPWIAIWREREEKRKTEEL